MTASSEHGPRAAAVLYWWFHHFCAGQHNERDERLFRLHEFPVHHQLLMVVNELNRAQNLINDPQEYKNCLERALELMDLFLADKSGSLLRETLRLRDIIAKSYTGKPDEVATIKNALLQMNPTAWTMLIKYSR